MKHLTDGELQELAREAFDAVHVPEGLNERTLAAIEARRNEPTADGGGSAPAQSPDTARESGAGMAEVIPFDRRAGRRKRRGWLVAAAACLIVAALGFGGLWWATAPTAYVTIDVNPSIELGVSRFDYVVSERALNADAEPVLDQVDLVGLPFGEALERLTASAAFSPYVTAGNTIEVDIAADDAGQGSALEAAGTHCLDGLEAHGSCHVVDEGTWEEAHHAGMGMARYRAALELMALDPSLTLDDCAAMSMGELRDRIAALGGTVEVDGADGADGEHHAEDGEHPSSTTQAEEGGLDQGERQGLGQGAQGSGHHGAGSGHHDS